MTIVTRKNDRGSVRGLCYFTDPDGNTVMLHATTDYNYKISAKTSDNRLEDGTNTTDNIVMGKKKFSFNGIVTEMVDKDYGLIAPTHYRKSIEKTISEKHVFDFIVDDFDFPLVDNCVITDVSFKRDANSTYAYNVSVSVEQLRFVVGAKVEKTTVPNPLFKDPHAKTEDTGDSTQEQVSQDGIANLKKRLKELEAENKILRLAGGG